MSKMMLVAGGLAVVLMAVVLGLWYAPEGSRGPENKAGGGDKKVKVDRQLADQGKQVASANGCNSCHSVDGSSGAGPSWKDTYGSEIELDSGKKVKVDDAYLKKATLNPNADVREGFGPSMPAFKDKLSASDVKAITEYIKSLQG